MMGAFKAAPGPAKPSASIFSFSLVSGGQHLRRTLAKSV
jgi:hypothetical protein